MKRWNKKDMHALGQKLFAGMYKKKRLAHPNHDIHVLARELDHCLTQGIESLLAGTYTPRFLKRNYFKDEVIDALYPYDRIMQHIILKQLKPTFAYVINPNCFHLLGPNGVGVATKKINAALLENKAHYFIRTDIKAYYKSISHQLLIQDLNRYYKDTKLLSMLEQIIKNPIETPNGYKNPDHGIPIRGPLSTFFSGVFLKDLDDAFDGADVHYFRYQDDILILCPTKRSFLRCKQRLMTVLNKKQLCLSKKKTKMGALDKGFHFLGVNYLGTQTSDIPIKPSAVDGHKRQQQPNVLTPVPHPRTLRKTREHVKALVDDGLSFQKIRCYLTRWARWWAQKAGLWSIADLLIAYVTYCWDKNVSSACLRFHPLQYADAN